MSDNYERVLDDLLMARSGGQHVVFRARYDRVVPEYSFWIGYGVAESGFGLRPYLSAHVTMADAVSIYDQVMELHSNNKQGNVKWIEKRIKLKQWTYTEMGCAAVKDQFEKLQRLNFSVPEFSNVITVDGPFYEIKVQASGTMNMELGDEKHPLLQWALQTRSALDQCASTPAATPKSQ
jgi:hypothetical protein